MLEGKAYYRAVRGYVMAYEALCQIKWKLFRSWAGERSSLQDLDDEVKLLHDLQINTMFKFCLTLSEPTKFEIRNYI